jgi:hypothetical protein
VRSLHALRAVVGRADAPDIAATHGDRALWLRATTGMRDDWRTLLRDEDESEAVQKQ